MRRAPTPEAVRAVQEVLLVDGLQHHDDRALQDLVLEGRDADRARLRARSLRDKDATLTLAVASTYRELGISGRAKQICEELYRTAPETASKQAAAGLLAHIVTEVGSNEDEEATWLHRADPTSMSVKNLLVEADARKLVREGKLAEADALYARAAEGAGGAGEIPGGARQK